FCVFFFSSRRRHTRWPRDWSSDVCSSDLLAGPRAVPARLAGRGRGVRARPGGLQAERNEQHEHRAWVNIMKSRRPEAPAGGSEHGLPAQWNVTPKPTSITRCRQPLAVANPPPLNGTSKSPSAPYTKFTTGVSDTS